MAEGIACGWRWIAKKHVYAFYVLRSTFKAVRYDGWDEWKALLVISVATEFAGFTIASVTSICLQRRVPLPQSKPEFLTAWGAVGFGLVILNYYNLLFSRKWSRYAEEFKYPSRMKRICGGVAVWLGLILIIAASEWTGSIVWKLPPY